jgi:hypothetical protein
MARFFFHNQSPNPEQIYCDPDGMEFPDLAAALVEAAAGARFLMADELRSRPILPGRWFDITDADGHILARLPFHDCLYQVPVAEISKGLADIESAKVD